MKIAMESLVAYEEWIQDPTKVLEKVETLGEAIIVKGNKPAYLIKALKDWMSTETADEQLKEQPRKRVRKPAAQSLNATLSASTNSKDKDFSGKGTTLKMAARRVLESAISKEMHVKDMAEAIFEQGLYTKRDGSKAPYTQVRAMCGQCSEVFETLEGNRVRLKV